MSTFLSYLSKNNKWKKNFDLTQRPNTDSRILWSNEQLQLTFQKLPMPEGVGDRVRQVEHCTWYVMCVRLTPGIHPPWSVMARSRFPNMKVLLCPAQWATCQSISLVKSAVEYQNKRTSMNQSCFCASEWIERLSTGEVFHRALCTPVW